MKNKSENNIAVDVMGGDHAPLVPVNGCILAVQRDPNLSLTLFGDSDQITPLLQDVPKDIIERLHIEHCSETISANDKPSITIRKGQKSSMNLAIMLVNSGECDAVVSAGNTGALMALSLFALRCIEGVSRPALGRAIPSNHGATCILDLGANLQSTTEHLVQYAMMGTAFAEAVIHTENPKVALLNVGTEEVKGLPEIRQADYQLQRSHLNYVGFIEGNDLFLGKADVIVTDGFGGNLVLKSAEGAFHMLKQELRSCFAHNILTNIGALLVGGTIKNRLSQYDPIQLEGAPLLGLRKTVVKAHAGTTGEGFANAIRIALELAQQQLPEKIEKHIKRIIKIPETETAVTETAVTGESNIAIAETNNSS